MAKKKFSRYLTIAVCLALITSLLTSCGWLSNKIKNVKGELIGNNFQIDFYDNFGSNILTINGNKVGLEANYVESKSVDSEGDTTTNYEQTSVVTITVDGSQIVQTGNTVIFAEEGIKKLEDFALPDSIQTEGGTLNIIDRNINNLKNLLGTPKVVVVCSQLGVPVAVYGGDNVYWEIPDDLPQTTKVSIDDKSLYILRSAYMLIDSEIVQ